MPRKIDDPWGRAEILLDAMSKMDGTDTHVYEWPAAVIRDLMADIMHYCAKRNEGLQPGQVDYLDPDKIFQQAKKQFVSELTLLKPKNRPLQTTMPAARSGRRKQADTWTRAMMDPAFAKTATALDQRQLRETLSLDISHQKEVHRLGASDQLTQKHDLETINLQKRFHAERMRYTREFLRGREIAEELAGKKSSAPWSATARNWTIEGQVLPYSFSTAIDGGVQQDAVRASNTETINSKIPKNE